MQPPGSPIQIKVEPVNATSSFSTPASGFLLPSDAVFRLPSDADSWSMPPLETMLPVRVVPQSLEMMRPRLHPVTPPQA